MGCKGFRALNLITVTCNEITGTGENRGPCVYLTAIPMNNVSTASVRANHIRLFWMFVGSY